MRKNSRAILTIGIICVLLFTLAFVGCTNDSTARKLERKGYITNVQVSQKNSAIEQSITKQIYAYNPKTGDHILIADYKTIAMAKEFYAKNAKSFADSNMQMVLRGKRVAYGTKAALKLLGYIRK